MIARMLVPLDGSAVAESILPTVQAVAHLAGAAVTLLRVIEPLEHQPHDRQPAASGPDRDRRAAALAQAYLAGVAQQLSQAGLAVLTHVAFGPPAQEIVTLARDFDLVAMGTHGRSGIGRWVYGSVADKVLHGATVPVLLVRARPGPATAAPQFRRLVVPLDGSALAEQALPLASDLARRAGATVVLTQSLYWVQTALADYPYGYAGGIADPQLLEEVEEGARDYLAEVGQRLAQMGVTTKVDLRYTPAADAILTCTAEREADLIVMSTHGRGGLRRWMLGSVADRVLRWATLPVLLVRAGAMGTTDEAPVAAVPPGA